MSDNNESEQPTKRARVDTSGTMVVKKTEVNNV